MRLRFLTISVLLLTGFQDLRAQCQISGKRNACVNDLTGFSISASGTISSWSWNFASYGTSSNASPTVKFTKEETLTLSCTITLAGGSTCADTHTIVIRPNPTASLFVDPANKYCLPDNKICLINTSTPAKSGLNALSLLWGDGGISSARPPLPASYCYQYKDTGTYKINLEIADSFGCKDVYTLNVRIRPGVTIAPTANITNFCDSVRICFNDNASGKGPLTRTWYDQSTGKKSGTGNPFCRIVKPGENVSFKVVTVNAEGCTDSTTIVEKAPENKLRIENIGAYYCMNEIESGQVTLSSNESVNWSMNGNNLGRASFMKITSGKTGWNKITITQTTPCPLTYTDSILIRTVRAIGKHYNEIRQIVQDTALFLDLTPRPPGSRLLKIWNFNDAGAPPCTTWTRMKQNVGLNCNFSRDSIGQHFYEKAGCYGARLFVYDSATGCMDDTVFNVFRNDSCEKVFAPIKVCLGDGVDFKLSRASWLKVQRNNYLLTDVVKPRDSFVLTNVPRKYVYTTTGVKSPVLVRFYGPDSHWVLRNGKIIFDTMRTGKGWVRDTMKNMVTVVAKPDARFSAVALNSCNPYIGRVIFRDSLLVDPKSLSIDWGDTMISYPVGSGATFRLNPLDHTYKAAGMYIITVNMRNRTDCIAIFRDTLVLGWQMDFTVIDKCGSNRICFRDSVSDYGSRETWNLQNGTGKLYWSWGDGGRDSGFSPCHTYAVPGRYRVVLTAVSRSGCTQTLTQDIAFSRPKAAIAYQPLIFCSEIRQYFDSSSMLGPASLDQIQKWRWDFNDGSGPKFVKDPAHIFPAGGTYRVRLVITTKNGCTDTAYRDMTVIGPQVNAGILTDSIGCSPLRITFANKSRQTGTFIWEFGDPDRNFLSTDKDTQVSFTYRKPGVYYAYLTGGDSFYNPTTGNRYYCSVRFPAPGAPQMRITVMPTAKVSFTGPDTLCLTDSAEFINTTADTLITAYRWHIDTLSKTIGKAPFRQRFPATGTFRVWMHPDFPGGSGCFDTAFRDVTVVALQPSFNYACEDAQTPELKLINTSNLKADNYKWTLLDPTDSSETLLAVSKDLRIKTDTGSRTICLALNTGAYCAIKYCRTVRIKTGVTLANVFTPGQDGFNDDYKVPLYGFRDFDIRIFNRWGELLFHSTDPGISWNGKVNNDGPELPSGTYFYLVRFRDPCNDELKEVNGSINLIR